MYKIRNGVWLYFLFFRHAAHTQINWISTMAGSLTKLTCQRKEKRENAKKKKIP